MRVLLLLVTLVSCSHLKHGVVFWEEQCPEGSRYRIKDDGRRVGKREWCEIPKGPLDGVKHGRYVRTWPDGTVREEGQYENGKQSGTWTRYHRDGTRMDTTEWNADEESGEQQRWYPNGKTMCRGWIRQGSRQGHWAGFFENGKKAWVGQFKEGRPYGEWTFYDRAGAVAREHDFEDLKPPAWWTRKNPCPDPATLHGAPPPEGRHVDCREQPKESLTAVSHGPTADLFPDGVVKVTGNYVHGDKHGRWITWRADGSPRVLETWKHGQLSGPRLEWDRHGVLISVTRYQNGAATKTWTRAWCPNGAGDDAGDWWVCE